MDEDSKALRIFKRLTVALPLLALPFVPAIGKVVAGLVLAATLHYAALQ